jgi:hypothetical protein
MSEPTIYDRGDLVWVRLPERQWQRGIVTDVFRAPITKREVVVVNGSGYYADDDVVPHHEPVEVNELHG